MIKRTYKSWRLKTTYEASSRGKTMPDMKLGRCKSEQLEQIKHHQGMNSDKKNCCSRRRTIRIH